MREETPILAELPELLFEDERVIALNKPSSMPVHPCGNFKFNSLSTILELCLKRTGLKTVHRLDRQTSGIVFFAKTVEDANNFRESLLSDKVKKVYYTRVKGDFSSICDTQGKVECNQSVFCDSHIDAIMNSCDPTKVPLEHQAKAKDAFTTFKFKYLT